MLTRDQRALKMDEWYMPKWNRKNHFLPLQTDASSRIPEVWELLDLFKEQCQLKMWKISKPEDWIKTSDDKYHNFLCIQTVHPSTFEKICANRKIAIREGISYRVRDVSYTAWLFLKSPPENLMESAKKDPELLRRNAIYDLSWTYNGKPFCLKLNETDSMVFKEFERFLEKELGVEVKPAQKLHALKT